MDYLMIRECVNPEQKFSHTAELVRFLSGMNSLVNLEVGLLSKGCAILSTLVWFLYSMNPLMKPKVVNTC